MTPSRPRPLLSRVADAVYWMGRYTERAENVARFIGVNRNLMLDLPRGYGAMPAKRSAGCARSNSSGARAQRAIIRLCSLMPMPPV